MFILNSQEIIKALAIRKIVNQESMPTQFTELSIDTRTLSKGAIYLAIHGKRFDGHSFLNKAATEGASLLIVDSNEQELGETAAIVVEDTLKAFEDIARAIRKKMNAKVFAITGSYGKTTSKELLHHILAKHGKCLKSFGTENNNIGLPKTLVKAQDSDKYAVFELGTNHFGEIAHLGSIAMPDCVILTGISEAHTEFLGDVEGVFKEKSSVFEVCPEAKAILNGDDSMLKNSHLAKDAIFYGSDKSFDVYWEIISEGEEVNELLINGRYKLNLRSRALFNANNVCAAIAAASNSGIDIALAVKYLEDFEFPKMRFEINDYKGITFINDAYNANPYAFKQSFKSLKRFSSKRKILVLADMAELGVENESAHADLAKDILDLKADHVFFIGNSMRFAYQVLEGASIVCSHYEDKDELKKSLDALVLPGDLVFLKGSRVYALETLIDSYKI